MVSLDGVAPSRMVCVSACVNLPLHHKVQKFSSGTGSPGWSRKEGHKTVVCMCVRMLLSAYEDVVSFHICSESIHILESNSCPCFRLRLGGLDFVTA